MANFFLSGVTAGPHCTAAHVHRLGHSREKDVPKLRDGNFDPSLLAPACHVGMVKAPCIRTCHSVSDLGGFRKPHTSAHSPGTPPGRHNGVGPGGTGDNKARFSEAEAKSLSRSPSQPRDRYRINDGIRTMLFPTSFSPDFSGHRKQQKDD